MHYFLMNRDWTTLNRTRAARASAFEHLIPEMLFANSSQSDPANAPQGISAVKALQVAAQQGQKIFTLTKDNIDQLNNISIDNAAKNEIRNAISQGKSVQVHEKEINYFGWSGSGYIIENPETGSGAYKITGGANGAALVSYLYAMIAFLLGSVDGYTGKFSKYADAWWSEKIKKLQSAAKLSKVVGVFGLLAGLFSISLSDHSLGAKLGLALISLTAFIITVEVVAFIVAAVSSSLVAFFIAGAVAALIAVLAGKLGDYIFASYRRSYQMKYAYV